MIYLLVLALLSVAQCTASFCYTPYQDPPTCSVKSTDKRGVFYFGKEREFENPPTDSPLYVPFPGEFIDVPVQILNPFILGAKSGKDFTIFRIKAYVTEPEKRREFVHPENYPIAVEMIGTIGDNTYGQLGEMAQNSYEPEMQFVFRFEDGRFGDVSALINATSSCAMDNSVAILYENGEIYTAGKNDLGQLCAGGPAGSPSQRSSFEKIDTSLFTNFGLTPKELICDENSVYVTVKEDNSRVFGWGFNGIFDEMGGPVTVLTEITAKFGEAVDTSGLECDKYNCFVPQAMSNDSYYTWNGEFAIVGDPIKITFVGNVINSYFSEHFVLLADHAVTMGANNKEILSAKMSQEFSIILDEDGVVNFFGYLGPGSDTNETSSGYIQNNGDAGENFRGKKISRFSMLDSGLFLLEGYYCDDNIIDSKEESCNAGECITNECLCPPELTGELCNCLHCVNGYCDVPYHCACTPDVDWEGTLCDKPKCNQGCGVHGICTAPQHCDCNPPDEWEGDTCMTPKCPDGCVHGVCFRPKHCVCVQGDVWGGVDCNTPVCDVDCGEHGQCEAYMDGSTWKSRCKCDINWTGTQCDQAICSPGFCKNGGTCITPGKCQCYPAGDWDGDDCSIPVCPNCDTTKGGICNVPNTCACKEGWDGPACDQPKCAENCDVHGNCTFPNTCVCDLIQGMVSWTGDACQNPICRVDCDPTNGGCTAPHTCVCNDPLKWKGLLCKTPVCTDDCGDHGTCTEPGVCVCEKDVGGNALYTGDLCDEPICAANCENNGRGTCVSPGNCVCNPSTDWEGDDCQTPKCEGNCDEHGTCVAPRDCKCDEQDSKPLYDGFDCQTPICENECVNGVCDSPGHCECEGDNLWTGETCNTPICGACVHGTCISPGNCQCTTPSEWKDDDCNTPVCDPKCYKHGSCYAPGKCRCEFGFSGKKCDEYYCFGVEASMKKVCSGHGTCGAPNNCTCDSDYEGTECKDKKKKLTPGDPGESNDTAFYATTFPIIYVGLVICVIIFLTVSIIVCLWFVFFRRKKGKEKPVEIEMKEVMDEVAEVTPSAQPSPKKDSFQRIPSEIDPEEIKIEPKEHVSPSKDEFQRIPSEIDPEDVKEN